MNDIKLRDATRILKKNGYTLNRIVGDHYHYYNDNNRRLTLVFHMKRNNSCPWVIWKRTVKEYQIQL